MTTAMHYGIVLLGIGFLIFIHELGHFLVAKACGVRVEKFSLGFGPRLLGFRRGDTDYALSLIPLGGYVKMAGENPGEGGTGAGDEFTSKSVPQRAAIALAGIAMNTLTALAAFIVAYRIGVQVTAPVVGSAEMGWPAWAARLQPGDRIKSVGGTEVHSFEEVLEEVALQRHDPVTLDLERPSAKGPLQVHVEVTRKRDDEEGIPKIGIGRPLSLTIDTLGDDTPASRAGLQLGDTIRAVDGKAVSSWKEVELALARRGLEPTALDVDRKGRTLRLSVVPQTLWTLGVEPAVRIVVDEVFEGAPAAKEGLRKGDQVRYVDGEPAETFEAFRRAVDRGALHPLSVGIVRGDGTPATLLIQPVESDGRRLLGFKPSLLPSHAVLADPPLGTPAYAAGLRGGDRILGLEAPGKGVGPVERWEQVERALEAGPGPLVPLVLHVQRGTARKDFTLESPGGKPEDLGLEAAVLAGAVAEGSPAAREGLRKGDRLCYLRLSSPPEGNAALAKTQEAWPGMSWLVQAAGSLSTAPAELKLDWARDEGPVPGPRFQRALTPVPAEPLLAAQLTSMETLGAYPDSLHENLRETRVLAACRAGLLKARNEAVKIVRTVSSFFAPKAQSISPKNLGGVLTIFRGANHFLSQGAGAFLLFLGVISVNLAVLNLLPVPVLDGGLILFLVIEKVKGSPLSDRSMAVFQYAGLALILSLVLFVTYHDIARLFG